MRLLAVALFLVAGVGCVSAAKARIVERPEAAGDAPADAIAGAWNGLDAEGVDAYNAALSGLLNACFLADDEFTLRLQETDAPGCPVHLANMAGDWEPGFFNHFIEASRVDVEGIEPHHRSEGIGVPLIGIKARTLTPGVVKYPPEGLAYPVTALAIPEESGAITLRLVNPYNTTSVEAAGAAHPLAADTTASYGFILARAKLVKLGRTGLFRYESTRWHEGLYVLQPYDPQKIPLIMVHGLVSSPATWKAMTNEIWGDPVLRTRYQIWHYMYPTSTPPLTAGRHFREALRATRLALDPELDDPAMNGIVLVGHSLGGLLCKTLVTESGDRLWYRRYERSLDEAELDAEARAIAEGTFFLSPEPYVSRVIFMATPAKGAHIAGSWFARLIARFVRPEGSAALLESKVYARDPNPKSKLRMPNSIRVLNPSYPVMDEFGKIPVAEGIPFYTIIGSRDGIVPYESAHMDGAESELIVDSGHDVTMSAAAVDEVKRILKLATDAR